MSEACSHSGSISCSCCSPLWKSFLPDTPIDIPEEKSSLLIETKLFRSALNKDGSPGKAILTLEDGQEVAVEAMGIHGGLVVATGSYQNVKAKMPKHTAEHQLSGTQTLLPGLIEPHVHIINTAMLSAIGNDVSPFDKQKLRKNYNRDWVTSYLAAEAKSATNKNDSWLIGFGADPSLFIGGEKEFNAAVLDKCVTDKRPVFVINASMHLAYINTCAIELVSKSCKDIPPDGILKEIAGIEPVVNVIVSSYPKAKLALMLVESVNSLFNVASQRGVTYMLDAGVEPKGAQPGFDQVGFLNTWAHLPLCPVRIGGALIVTSDDDFNNKVVDFYSPGYGDKHFHLPYIKVISDGSNQGLTGYQSTPYCCNNRYEKTPGEENIGAFNFNPLTDINTLVQNVVDKNWPLMIHTNGDEAIRLTLASFKEAGVTSATYEQRRDRLEHASLLTDDHLSEMKLLGISPSFLIGHVGYWGWAFQQTILGEERADHLDRCQSALNHGMRITLHSDNGVTPLGPLRMMEQAISRVMEGASQETASAVLSEKERISRFAALKAATYDAAWQCHADKWVGSLVAGKCADFVILADSPLTYDSADKNNPVKNMRNIPVLETWKGGRKVYSGAGHS
ncbi:amidohydrolase [Pectobacterium brasiliense]|uniref:amidohydrolase n=1 Tax=Pectobacterium brasiliense TaxID=180957 RepID=UPI0019D3E5D6|nr:amidohydrolase [Pectobacterium brasiliense]MBN7766249.1 amidohydrolase [Pectobacterium brasiliense]MDY4384400.1 amidohydrolase family protein [Pectobacterium brasiliense]